MRSGARRVARGPEGPSTSPPPGPRQRAHPAPRPVPPAVWAGFECSRVRIGRRRVDQLELTGHHTRSADIDALAWLGVSAVRYPVLWERVAARGLAGADWSWPDQRLEALRRAGIRPIAGLLHHGGGPQGISLLHPGFPAAFARYAATVARRYPWLRDFLPINEPLTTARFAGLYGIWQPHARSDLVFSRLLIAQVLAIRAAIEAIREIRPDARLIVNEDVGRTSGTPDMADQSAFLNLRRWLTWDLLLGRVTERHPMCQWLARSDELAAALASLVERPCPPDVLGVDHYVTSDRFLDHRLGAYPPHLRPAEGRPAYVDVEAVRVAGIPLGGIGGALADSWERYRRPMALTEVALAGEPLDQVAWWEEAWNAARDAAGRGVRIEAVTSWAVMGATGWDTLLRDPRRYEPGCFDVRHEPPQPTPLAFAVRETAREARAAGLAGRQTGTSRPPLAASQQPPQRVHRPAPAHRHAGWWRRPDRFIHLVR